MTKKLGYDTSSVTWTYDYSVMGNKSTVDFTEESKVIGRAVNELVAAAKRVAANKSGSHAGNVAHALRRGIAAIVKHAPQSMVAESWADALMKTLVENSKLSQSTKWSYYSIGCRLFKEAARSLDQPFRRSNTFTHRAISQKPVLDSAALSALVAQARVDVLAYVDLRKSPPPDHLRFIKKANRLAAGGLLKAGAANKKSRVLLLAEEWTEFTGLRFSELTKYLYPSAYDLIPFLVLLSIALAANPDSLSFLRRNAIRSNVNPVRGAVIELTLDKPRGGEIPQYALRDGGTLSSGWLVRKIVELTQPLVRIAEPRNSKFAFLVATRQGKVLPLVGALRSNNMHRYLKDKNLPDTTLKMIRPARLSDEYKRTNDPFRVKRLAQHSSLAMSAAYIGRPENENIDAIAIANLQREIANQSIGGVSTAEAVGSAWLPSHNCLNPLDGSVPKDENGLCSSYLWPFNDAHHVIQFEPLNVAYILRDYGALREAEKSISPERFAKLYAPRMRIIEEVCLSQIDADLRDSAEALLPTIAPAPGPEVL
jgi:hypothetical protein